MVPNCRIEPKPGRNWTGLFLKHRETRHLAPLMRLPGARGNWAGSSRKRFGRVPLAR